MQWLKIITTKIPTASSGWLPKHFFKVWFVFFFFSSENYSDKVINFQEQNRPKPKCLSTLIIQDENSGIFSVFLSIRSGFYNIDH